MLCRHPLSEVRWRRLLPANLCGFLVGHEQAVQEFQIKLCHTSMYVGLTWSGAYLLEAPSAI
jgi:hypothetical protein